MLHNTQIFKQLAGADGNLSYAARPQNPYVYWTITTWDSRESMMKFRNSGAHLEAMKELRNIASKAKSGHWEADEKPGWKEAWIMMLENMSSRY